MLESELHCCGMADVQCEGKTALDNLKDFWLSWEGEEDYSYRPPIIVLSERLVDPAAGKLVALIRKHKLGEVVQTRSKINPNSKNRIRAYLWTPSRKALNAFAKKRGWKLEDDEDYSFGGW